MATKKDITEAAFYLFAAKGFHETSMEDLAEALGIKKQSLYSHFKSKTEIIMSVMQIQAEKIKAELDHLIRTHCTQPIEQLLKFFFYPDVRIFRPPGNAAALETYLSLL